MDKVTGYVVARIRTVNRKIMPNGKEVPPREIFPSPSEFGFNGWFYESKPKSKRKTRQQVRMDREKTNDMAS